MGVCNIDHSRKDVIQKLDSQKMYLPAAIFEGIHDYLQNSNISQLKLNEIFHLLKKYDLATADEQKARNEKLSLFLLEGQD